jgi:hypothetical protein
VLRPAGDLGLDPHLGELAAQELAGLADVVLALLPLLGDELLDLVVLARVQALEREILQLPLDRVDPEPVSERGIDLQRLARLLDLLVLGQRARVRMLWRRSASLIRMTRTSVAIATIILR